MALGKDGLPGSTSPPTSELRDHLYQSFLLGRAADVTLDVYALSRWSAQYRLHRVVLTQAGFFHSLFTAGFLEQSLSPHSVTIRFPDSNISRSAFEFCLARLYGGGPPLYTINEQSNNHEQLSHFSSDHQNASPAFLMSLLATATYLSIPSVAHLAISTIVSNITPFNVLTYLNYAIGSPIDNVEQLDEPALGLGSVAHLVSSNSSIISEHPCSVYAGAASMADDENDEKHNGPPLDSSHYYGVLSDRLGHACACWLTRWGADLIDWEDGPNVEKAPRVWRRGGLTSYWARAILSSDFFFVKSEWHRYQSAKRVVELRRREGISSDEEVVWESLFENGIVYVHMSFDQLHEITNEVSPTTSEYFVKPSIIHTANWLASELRHSIVARTTHPSSPSAQPISPSSPVTRDKLLGVIHSIDELHAKFSSLPLSALQCIVYRVPGDVVEPFFSESEGSPTAIPMDETIFSHIRPPKKVDTTSEKNRSKISEFFGIYEEPMFAASVVSQDPNNSAKWSRFPPLRFGVEFWDLDLLREKNRLHSQTLWYAGSLFNVYTLVVRKKDGQGAQLGIYVHRQSSVEPIPLMSVANGSSSLIHFSGDPVVFPHSQSNRSSTTGSLSGISGMSRGIYVSPIDTRAKLSINADGTGTFSRGSSPSTSRPASGSTAAAAPSLANASPPEQSYRDPRSLISAYFTISCAGPSGTSITKFSSGPDVFGVGQSWGWKATSSRSEEYLHTDGYGHSKKSLRATVTLGLV